MKLKKTTVRFLGIFLSVGILQMQTMHSANAGMLSTAEVVTKLNGDLEREKVAKYLEREDVKQQLMKYGVDANEASLRLASLSDAEIQRLSGQIDKSVAGGGVVVAVSLVGVLIIVLIIFLIRRM